MIIELGLASDITKGSNATAGIEALPTGVRCNPEGTLTPVFKTTLACSQ